MSWRSYSQPAKLVRGHAGGGQEIGASHVADEERVTGEDGDRHGGVRTRVGRHDRDPLGRVTGGLEDGEAGVARLDHVALVQRADVVLGGSAGAQADPRADALPQLEVAGYEIRVEVGQEDGLDRRAQLVGGVEVLLDVPPRIDDDGAAARLVDDDVGRLGEAAEIELLDDHGVVLPWRCSAHLVWRGR